MSSAGGGWLQAKKRGRDDEQIALDSKAALEQRKQRHRSSGGGVGKNVKKQPPVVAAKAIAQKKKKHSQKRRKRGGLLSDDDSDDDDDSIDDFVVDDEEEIVDDSSEEEELVIEKPKSTASRRKAHSKAYDDDDDDDSDDELTEVGEASARKRRLAVAAVTSARTILHTESSDEDSSNGIFSMNAFPKRTSKPPPPRQQPKPNQAKLKKLSNSKPSKVRNPIAIPAAIDTKSTRSMSIDDNSFASESELFIDKKPAAVAVSRQEASLDGDLEDTPVVPSAIRKKPTKNKHVVKKEKSFKSSASSSKFRKVITEDDYCSDVDEAVAMACAMEESTKMAKVSASSSPVDSGEDVVELLDDDDDENDGNEQDDYVEDDANARAASSILATANTLSAQVLNTLAGWSKTATDGMIVDGALALSSMAHGNESSGPTGHTWISNETMREILPTVELSEYQLIGVNWLALLHGMKVEMEGTRQHTNVNGILADEMGLGKTCQTIAFLSWLKHVKGGCSTTTAAGGGSKDSAVELVDSDDESEGVATGGSTQHHPHLVIAPASVVSNWVLEFEKFAPQLNVVKYHGSMDERLEIRDELQQYLPRDCRPSRKGAASAPDVILAPVTYFQQEKSDDRDFLRKFKYDYMVVDEAHLLKNARGMRYRSLDRFSTMHRLLLTGTPIQNSPKELMSLLCFLMPLFSRSTMDDAHDGGESMLQYFVSMQNGAENDEQVAYRKLKQLFSPFVLRRRKQDVLSQILPPKEQKVEYVELDAESRDRYNAIIADHVKAKRKGTASVYEHLFTQLRKAAHHPLMLRSRYTTTAEKEHLTQWFYQYGAFRGEGCTKAKVAEELEKYTDFEIHLTASELIAENGMKREQLGRYILDEQDLFCSAKFVRLQKLLPELIADGHRILIFSVWTTCLDLLSCLLEQMGLRSLRMDGQTPVSERQSLIDQFNRDGSIPIFLLSTKACGLGLNLTSADVCIQHDLDFNPAVDAQAEDRCHRIGQTKKVTIIKLVAKDTVDEDIYAMQQRKAKMNAAIMGSDAEWNKQTKGDKKQMLETAVNRFLKSPNAHTKAGTGGTDTSRLLPAEPTIPTKSDPEIDTVQKADSECL